MKFFYSSLLFVGILFIGCGTVNNKKSSTEVFGINATSSDNNQSESSIDIIPPMITGEPKKVTNVYNFYQFLPITTDVNRDALTFSIKNKPFWADFNSSTALLSGIPTEEGNFTNITISVSDGTKIVNLAPFSIEVKAAIDLAHNYGKATQGTDKSYSYYGDASNTIDNNDSTYNHTRGGKDGKNWLQIELPNPTKVFKVIIQNRNKNKYRLTNAKVYLNNTPYSGNVNENSLIATLQPTNDEQIITLTSEKNGQYLLIKGEERNQDDRHLQLKKVEVYGTAPVTPVFDEDRYQVTIDKYQSKSVSFLDINATDYQEDSLTYSLISPSLPIRVDTSSGELYVTDILSEGNYTEYIRVSDGINSVEKEIKVTIIANTIVKTIRTFDASPALSGSLPNIYNDGENIVVVINGQNYIATVNNDGRWSLDAGYIAPLSSGNYDVKLVVNGREILYPNYFSVDGRLFAKVILPVVAEPIKDIEVTVNSHTQRDLVADEEVRGTSVELNVSANSTKIENNSYRKIASLIGEYTDANGVKKLVRLKFSQPLLPYSSNVLNSFAHDANMTIYHTANMFDAKLSFGGEVCDENTDTSKTHYCVPTTQKNQETYSTRSTGNDEQELYSIAWSSYNHLYNSVHGFNSFKAWVEKGRYDGIDLSFDNQSSPRYIDSSGQDSLDYMYEKWFGMVMPNHSSNMRVMRYQYASQGRGGLPRSRPLTYLKNIGSWASEWEGAIDLDASDYNTIHHEVMHNFSYGHSSGMTYGWSHALERVIPHYYEIKTDVSEAKNPTVNAPKYIFKSKKVSDGKIQLTVHKTTDAGDNPLSFDIFSATKLLGDEISITREVGDATNQVTISYKIGTLKRLLIRMYGDDSLELMSEFFVF